ncbi:MAG: hypothetical protein JXA97_13870 [Anaerolineales bacterium]|nr:hypothetical protein [Anaerolineales bacterium]
MIGIGLRQLEEVINARADALQREFIDLSSQLNDLGRDLLELRGDERQAARERQKLMRQKQQALAEEVNTWRERARAVTHQPGKDFLLAYFDELETLGFDEISRAVQRSRVLIETGGGTAAEDEIPPAFIEQTPVQRLIERARTDYVLRGKDVGVREREAVTFANRRGAAQDDNTLAEMMAAMSDGDALVRELAGLTTIQLLRFRALRSADLEIAHQAVKELAKLTLPAVVPALIEILEQPRTGFVEGEEGPQEGDNSRSRMVALLRLVEWHTPDAEQAVRGRLRDRDSQIIRVAQRALDLFPDPWAGPLK